MPRTVKVKTKKGTYRITKDPNPLPPKKRGRYV